MTAQAPELAAVVAGLEKVERELLAERHRNRRLLAAVGLVVVGVGPAWIVAKTTAIAQAQGTNIGPKVIRANPFILEDEKGNARVRLSAIKEAPALALFDENGKDRAVLLVDSGGPMITLLDETGKKRWSQA
jgi:hypothetical protein